MVVDAAIEAVVIDAAIEAVVVDAAHTTTPPDAPPLAVSTLPALEMRTLKGPSTSIADYCNNTNSEALDEPGHGVKCNTAARWKGKKQLARAAPPFAEAKLFMIEAYDPHCQLAIRIDRTWFVLPDAVRCAPPGESSSLASRVVGITVEDFIPGGAAELVLRAVYDLRTDTSPQTVERVHLEVTTICGIAGGVPSCTRELPTVGTREEQVRGAPAKKSAFSLAITARPGQIEISGDVPDLATYSLYPLAAGTYSVPL